MSFRNLLLRSGAGAVAGGSLFFSAARAQDDGSEQAGTAMTTSTLFGVAAGAVAGSGFPLWKKTIGNRYSKMLENMKDKKGSNLRKAYASSLKSYDKEVKTISRNKSLTAAKRAEEISKISKPAITDVGVRLNAMAETFLNPGVTVPVGMMLGSSFYASRGGDPVAGAFTGGTLGFGAGLGYHGYKVYEKSPVVMRAGMGAGLTTVAYGIGASSNDSQYQRESRVVPDKYSDSYDEQVIYENPGIRRRMETMGASGGVVLGSHNKRHG